MKMMSASSLPSSNLHGLLALVQGPVYTSLSTVVHVGAVSGFASMLWCDRRLIGGLALCDDSLVSKDSSESIDIDIFLKQYVRMIYPSTVDDGINLNRQGTVLAHSVKEYKGQNVSYYDNYTKKLRPVGMDALLNATGRRNIALTGVRNVGISTLIVVNGHLQQLYEEEDRAQQAGEEPKYPPFPWSSLTTATLSGTLNACVDFATQLTRIAIDWWATRTLPMRLGRKLRKDLRASAFRKGEKFYFWWRGPMVMKTAYYSEATFFAADYTVTCVLECYMAIKTLKNTPMMDQLKRLGMRFVLQAGRCFSGLLVTSFGLGVGSMAPRRIRPLCMLISAQAMSLLINIYFRNLILRLTGGWPPPDQQPPTEPKTLSDKKSPYDLSDIDNYSQGNSESCSHDTNEPQRDRNQDGNSTAQDHEDVTQTSGLTPLVGPVEGGSENMNSMQEVNSSSSVSRPRRRNQVAGLGAPLPRRPGQSNRAVQINRSLVLSGAQEPGTPQAPREPRQTPGAATNQVNLQYANDRDLNLQIDQLETEGDEEIPPPPETPPVAGR